MDIKLLIIRNLQDIRILKYKCFGQKISFVIFFISGKFGNGMRSLHF
jgi:hypothetical protein